jgi:hypothetical protein
MLTKVPSQFAGVSGAASTVRRDAVVETLVYAAFIARLAMLAGERLLAHIRGKLRCDQRNRLPRERWAAVLVASEITCPVSFA